MTSRQIYHSTNARKYTIICKLLFKPIKSNPVLRTKSDGPSLVSSTTTTDRRIVSATTQVLQASKENQLILLWRETIVTYPNRIRVLATAVRSLAGNSVASVDSNADGLRKPLDVGNIICLQINASTTLFVSLDGWMQADILGASIGLRYPGWIRPWCSSHPLPRIFRSGRKFDHSIDGWFSNSAIDPLQERWAELPCTRWLG